MYALTSTRKSHPECPQIKIKQRKARNANNNNNKKEQAMYMYRQFSG